ncbi:MAG: beta-lactamase family protein, partial [Emcibacteraceae bacterium]|nr:beta-lactamase family protein [Emcibacteraceae bacterium]
MKTSLLKPSLIVSLFIFAVTPSYAAELAESTLDNYVEKAMQTFDIPGIAVGIIKNGEIEHLKGYGVREAGNDMAINPDTMYAIASNSKAFTSSALAILVDDGLLDWDDKVIDYIPNFRLMDPWITREFTIRDLLTHRSGMGLGAGDLMFWPTTEVSREEIIHNVRHLKMVSGFRASYAYDNLLYVVAGEVIAVATNMSYEQFVQTRIINQLAMGTSCFADLSGLKPEDNIAEPHVLVDGKMQKATRLQEFGEPMVIAAAGGLQCSARALMSWLNMHLNDGAGLISKRQH